MALQENVLRAVFGSRESLLTQRRSFPRVSSWDALRQSLGPACLATGDSTLDGIAGWYLCWQHSSGIIHFFFVSKARWRKGRSFQHPALHLSVSVSVIATQIQIHKFDEFPLYVRLLRINTNVRLTIVMCEFLAYRYKCSRYFHNI